LLRARSRLRPLVPLLGLALALSPAARADEPVAFLHEPPAQGVEGEPIEVIGEFYGAGLVQSAAVRYRRVGEKEWHSALLLPAGGMLLRAVLSAARVKRPALEYWVEGVDLLNKKSALFGGPSETQLVPVAMPGALSLSEIEVSPRPLLVPNDPASGRRREEPSPEEWRTLTARPVPMTAPVPEPPAPGTRRKKAASSHLALFAPLEPGTLAAGRPQTLAEAAGVLTVLGEDMLKLLGVHTVAEALRLVPGMDESRDVLGFARASARGLRDDAGVLVLYDGHKLNDAYDGRGALDLPIENLERIEVLRGPGSALNGPGALLATVNLVPRRRDGIALSAEGNTLSQGSVHFHGGGQVKGFQMDGDVSVSGGKGLATPIPHDALTDALRAQGLLGPAQAAGTLDDRGLTLNAGTRIIVPKLLGGELELKARFLHQGRGVSLGLSDTVGGSLTTGGGEDSQVRREILLADLAWKRPLGESGSFALALSGDQRDEERNSALAPPNFTVGATAYPRGVHVRELWTTRTASAEARLELHPDKLWRALVVVGARREELTFYEPASDVSLTGAPLAELRVPSVELAQRRSDLDARNDLYALVHGELNPHETVSLVASLRVDALPGPGQATGAACAPPACSLRARPAFLLFSPRLGLGWTALPSLRLKLLAGIGFRAPTLEELTRQVLQPPALRRDQLGGDQELSPTVANTVEAVADWTDQLAWGRASVRLDVFYTALANVIQAPPEILAEGVRPVFVNAASALTTFGAGLEGRVERSRRFFALASLGAQSVRDTAFADGALRAVPAFTASLGGSVPVGPLLGFSLVARVRSGRQGDARTPLDAQRPWSLPATVTLDATLRTEPIFKVAEAALSCQDLLGTEQRDDVPRPDLVPGLLPRAGRVLSLSLRARF
jgi:outer membrane receptor protein involved in Fe transport